MRELFRSRELFAAAGPAGPRLSSVCQERLTLVTDVSLCVLQVRVRLFCVVQARVLR